MHKERILAVDDDPIILEMYRTILEDDYRLHLALSSDEALTLLRAHPRMDLILLDIIMPGLDGYEICKRIRENPLFRGIKIIFVSSKMLIGDRLRAYDIGADDYLTKPFEAGELIAKIKVFMRLKKSEEINKIKTNFINLLYHETRTPLTSIFGYASLLRQSANLTAQEIRFVDHIQRCGEMILKSCEKTMLLSDLKSGSIAIEKARVPISIFFSDQQMGQPKSPGVHQEVHICGDSNLWIEVDPKLFGIAIDTLICNALKFSYPGTTVEVTLKSSKGSVQIEVANDGDQITPEQQEIIFSEFVVKDLSHHQDGPGLSLAIARRIVEAHDGTLTVINRGAGPVFIIEMNN